jgi:5-methylcytosine-specific restriction protein A
MPGGSHEPCSQAGRAPRSLLPWPMAGPAHLPLVWRHPTEPRCPQRAQELLSRQTRVMARRALSPCTVHGCPELVERGRCPAHRTEAERARGSASQRGYGHKHAQRFRRGVLARDPICTMPGCYAWSKHADHWPIDRRTLVLRGLDPNDLKHGRGLCTSCHSRETALHQPGGWNAR